MAAAQVDCPSVTHTLHGRDAMQIELNLPGVEVPAIRDGLRPGSFAVQALLEVRVLLGRD